MQEKNDVDVTVQDVDVRHADDVRLAELGYKARMIDVEFTVS